MNPWIVIGILGWMMNDRSREAVELQSLRKTFDDIKDQLAAATARNALAPPPQPEPHPYWAEPIAEPVEREPFCPESGAPLVESSATGGTFPGELVQSILDGEGDYVWRMNDRAVEDYGGPDELD